jgi:hypothetical protein
VDLLSVVPFDFVVLAIMDKQAASQSETHGVSALKLLRVVCPHPPAVLCANAEQGLLQWLTTIGITVRGSALCRWFERPRCCAALPEHEACGSALSQQVLWQR